MVRLAVMAAASIILSLGSLGSEEAAAFVKRMESFRGEVYRDAGGRRTIGYGATSASLVRKEGISRADASRAVLVECQRLAGLLHKELGENLKPHEEIALVSFVYNIGWANFRRSRMYRLLKAGHRGGYVGAEFGRWVYYTRKGRKVKSEGLRIRRNAEAQMFMYGRVA